MLILNKLCATLDLDHFEGHYYSNYSIIFLLFACMDLGSVTVTI